MKNLLYFILLVNCSFIFSQNDSDELSLVEQYPLKWEKSYEVALSKAKSKKKPVLLYFKGSDWCAPCKVLERELFYTEKFKAIADKKMILLEVDIPRNHDILSKEKMAQNQELKSKYKINSFPSLIFVNYRGKVLEEKNGVILTEYYFPFIEKVLNDFYK